MRKDLATFSRRFYDLFFVFWGERGEGEEVKGEGGRGECVVELGRMEGEEDYP